MKKLLFLFASLVICLFVSAQESNNGKKLWAKSMLNEKAPELVVEEWLSQKPELKGKFVIIDFWATWCGPCRQLIPEMNAIAKKFSKNVVVIGLSDEPAGKVKAMDSPVIEYYSGIDTKGTMKKLLEVKGIPHVIIIDPKGIIRWEGFPALEGHELTEEVIANLIKKYK